MRLVKTVAAQRLVFGWATVNPEDVDANGNAFAAADLEHAVYQYVLRLGDAGEMHQGASVGKLVESLVVTPEKLAAMGLSAEDAATLPHVGWFVGFQLSPDAFGKVLDGTYKMLSIQGTYRESEPL